MTAVLSKLKNFLQDRPPADKYVVWVVLALAGAKDQQVAPDTNQAAIARALNADENPDVTVRTLDGLNHLFQHAETGLPAEYAQIEETFAPEALEMIGDWIEERFEER